ncbi:MAG: nitronate monooxygenase, partial [Actinobacteria bacterium]|nr:nitronate monooxygenase [Actinomycetota bacterium]
MGKRVLRTRLCDMLGIEYPIMSAGMGPNLLGEETGAPVELVVAVSEAGGLGVLGGSGYSIEELRQAIRDIKARTDKPYGVDLLLPKNVAGMDEMAASGVEELPLSQILQTLPQPYQDWIAKMRKDLDIPEVEIMVKTDSTTMR